MASSLSRYACQPGAKLKDVDLLQGRISSSVFVNRYYRPDINEIIADRIRPVLDKLLKEMR